MYFSVSKRSVNVVEWSVMLCNVMYFKVIQCSFV